jgi:hypothetical protein
MIKEKELEWIKISKKPLPYVPRNFEEYVDTTKQYCKQVWDDGYEEIFRLAGKAL